MENPEAEAESMLKNDSNLTPKQREIVRELLNLLWEAKQREEDESWAQMGDDL